MFYKSDVPYTNRDSRYNSDTTQTYLKRYEQRLRECRIAINDSEV